jgi:hypothetical protein
MGKVSYAILLVAGVLIQLLLSLLIIRNVSEDLIHDSSIISMKSNCVQDSVLSVMALLFCDSSNLLCTVGLS